MTAKAIHFHEFVHSYIAIHNKTAVGDNRMEFSTAWLRACRWLEINRHNKRLLLMAFRGFGKSHLASLFICWNLLLDPNFTAIIVSATERLATMRAAFIRTVIERHPLCQHLVPNKDADTGLKEKWTRNAFTVVRPGVMINESVHVTAVGAQMVGLHSDLLLADDVEVAENSATAKDRHELRTRIMEFVPIAKRVLYIGTPWSEQSIYPELESKYGYIVLKLPIYRDDEAGVRTYVWPTRYGEVGVEEIRSSVTSAHFDSQYLLIPATEGSRGLPTNSIRGYSGEIEPDPTEHRRRVLCLNGNRLRALLAFWDPSTGLEGRDDSILAVVAADEQHNTYLHRIVKLPAISEEDGWRPQTAEIIRVCKEIGVGRVLIENSVNPTLTKELKDAGNDQKVRLAIEKVNVTTNKAKRISGALEAPMASGRFFAHSSVLAEPSLFLEQAESFPTCVTNPHELDDAIDAAASGVMQLPEAQGRFGPESERIKGVGAEGRQHIAVTAPTLSASLERPRLRRWP